MSDFPEGTNWWKASDGRWYAPPATADLSPPTNSPAPPAEERAAARAESDKKAGRGCLVAFVAVVAVIVIGSIAGSGDNNSDEPAGDELKFGAFDVCTQFVKERLRAPGSASFPNQFEDDGEVLITGGPETWTVSSHVDAENGFGGEVRTDFVCTVRHTGGSSFTLVDLRL